MKIKKSNKGKVLKAKSLNNHKNYSKKKKIRKKIKSKIQMTMKKKRMMKLAKNDPIINHLIQTKLLNLPLFINNCFNL